MSYIDYIPEVVDTDKFALWAFGEDYKELTTEKQFLDSWNYLHGKDLPLTSSVTIPEDAEKMVKLWKDKK